jgi:predicted DNA binding protein
MTVTNGIRATVKFRNSDVCPISETSAQQGTTVDSVSANVCLAESERGTLEVSMTGDEPGNDAFTPVFSYGSTGRYRLERGGDCVGCPCECLGKLGCPVAEYTASDGVVTLVFHAADFGELRTLVTALQEEFPSAVVKRFVQSTTPTDDPTDAVFVDRNRLTARQREVIRTAYTMGYFAQPRKANASEVAAELNITQSTFSQHLASAEETLFEELFEV